MTETLRYWYDCEFIDDGKTIDLISIGIVCDDGREFYGINWECNFIKASDWVAENVLTYLPFRPCELNTANKGFWYQRYFLKEAVAKFLGCQEAPLTRSSGPRWFIPEGAAKPELWGYYSAYDHVALCQLFGTMMDLPQGFPMYTRDIKQWCDALGNPQLPKQAEGEHNALHDARHNKVMWEFLKDYVGDLGE